MGEGLSFHPFFLTYIGTHSCWKLPLSCNRPANPTLPHGLSTAWALSRVLPDFFFMSALSTFPLLESGDHSVYFLHKTLWSEGWILVSFLRCLFSICPIIRSLLEFSATQDLSSVFTLLMTTFTSSFWAYSRQSHHLLFPECSNMTSLCVASGKM